ncbi:MAG: biotin/lipoyl-containing protein, partial [Planctomycetota bacterium]
MANSVPLPDLGEGVESGDVLDIFVSVGDSVSEGDDLIEVETDKATAAVPSPFTGTIASIAVSEGDTVTVGMEILTIDAAGGGEVPVEQAPAAPVEQAPAQPAPAPTPDPPAAPPVQPVSPPA